MNLLPRLLMGACATLFAGAVAAESLRCNGVSVAEGESRLSVRYKCGEPLLKDGYCAQVYYQGSQGQTLQAVPGAWAAANVPCQPMEDWVYERGPGNLVATVRFKSGVVQSILYGRSPQSP